MTDDETRDRYHARFAQSGVPQAILALDGTIAAVNAATCSMFDRTPEELVGDHLLNRVPAEGRDDDARLLAAVLSGQMRWAQLERRLDHRDGRFLDTLVSVAAVHDSTGQLREISVCLQDNHRPQGCAAGRRAGRGPLALAVAERERHRPDRRRRAGHQLRQPVAGTAPRRR